MGVENLFPAVQENIDLLFLDQGVKKNIWVWISASKLYSGENYIIQILIARFTPQIYFCYSINLNRHETRIRKIRVIFTVSFKNCAFWPHPASDKPIHLYWGRINFSLVGLCCRTMFHMADGNLSSLKHNHSSFFTDASLHYQGCMCSVLFWLSVLSIKL